MRARGFTLVEVLVALVVVALGLAALSSSVSGTARSSTILRDKMQAQWIALNRLTEVRLNLAKFGNNTDTGEVNFANRTWHYDTRYFDTQVQTMRRIVVRVYAGDAKTKGNPLAETVGFVSSALPTPPGSSSTVDWRMGTNAAAAAASATTPGSGTTLNSLQTGAATGTGTPTATGTPTGATGTGTPTPTSPTTPTPSPTP